MTKIVDELKEVISLLDRKNSTNYPINPIQYSVRVLAHVGDGTESEVQWTTPGQEETKYVPDPKRPLYRMCYLCLGVEGPTRLLEPLPGNNDLLACPDCTAINLATCNLPETNDKSGTS